MGHLPKISRDKLLTAYDRVVELFEPINLPLLIQSAQLATVHADRPIFYSAGASIDDQVAALRRRIGNIGDDEGQDLYVLWIESLCTSLNQNPIPGVDDTAVRDACYIEVDLVSSFVYNSSSIWRAEWKIVSGNNQDRARVTLRNLNDLQRIVPKYVYEYIDQSLSAFQRNRNGVSMALISIALEASVRDALVPHGFTHNQNGPTSDIYQKIDITIQPEGNDYRLSLNGASETNQSDFNLIVPPGTTSVSARIKRLEYNGAFKLQIDGNDDVVPYLSSSAISQSAVSRISGLGKAMQIARSIGVINPYVFPEDLDTPIQAVRNNLIHLSGAAMTQLVLNRPSGNITLQEFIDDDEKVFDALINIVLLVDELYS